MLGWTARDANLVDRTEGKIFIYNYLKQLKFLNLIPILKLIDAIYQVEYKHQKQ